MRRARIGLAQITYSPSLAFAYQYVLVRMCLFLAAVVQCLIYLVFRPLPSTLSPKVAQPLDGPSKGRLRAARLRGAINHNILARRPLVLLFSKLAGIAFRQHSQIV